MSPQPRRILPQPMYREAFSSARFVLVAQLGQQSERGRPALSENTDPVESLEQLADRIFGQFLESALDAAVIADIDGRITRLNTRAEKLFGYSRQELIGRDVEVLIPQRFREQHVEQRTAYLDNPKTRPLGTGLEVYGLGRMAANSRQRSVSVPFSSRSVSSLPAHSRRNRTPTHRGRTT